MKLYVVDRDDSGCDTVDYGIVGIFSTKENAVDFMRKIDDPKNKYFYEITKQVWIILEKKCRILACLWWTNGGKAMKFLDLFAGVGGIRLGMEQAGHSCVGWVEWDKFARESYIAIHKPDGEFTEKDINNVTSQELPKADCWCFGFPCQDISVAGKQGGFTNGKRSSLFFKVTGLIRELKEEDKPSYLFIENVKNLLSINKGWDFAKLLIEMDEIGYDVEWDVLDSAEVVPQHRERIFIVGHLRGRRTRKVFPIIRKNGETDNQVKQVGNLTPGGSFGGNPQVGRVYGIDGIAPTLSTMQGGGQEPKIVYRYDEIKRVASSVKKYANVIRPNAKPIVRITSKKNIRGSRQDSKKSGLSELQFTNPGNKSSTVTASHAPKIWDKDLRIRKLTPLECWRLQGFPDWALNRAREAGLSDSQLYKQAGNSVTVPVIKVIAENMEVFN